MKLLIHSPAFLPKVGGLEINTAELAGALAQRGWDVTVWTTTSGSDQIAHYRVLRNPGPLRILRSMRRCDVFLQANISLRGLWPLLFVRRPWVVSHHSWYCRPDGRLAWRDRLKRFTLRYAAASIAVSEAMARDVGRAMVITNPYRDSLFRRLPGVRRDRQLIFVGRLVSDKGVDILLDALSRMAQLGVRPNLTVVGDGPEGNALSARAANLGLNEQVTFTGILRGEQLVEALNRHSILVAPSRYNEPFGIVALEGIACGCVAVGSRGGGLPEAIGPCGVTFPNGDVEALGNVLSELLTHPERHPQLLCAADEHLAKHRMALITDQYEHVLHQVVKGEANPSP